MKQGWEIKTIGELAVIKGGKRVPKGYHLETIPTNYPYIRVTDFNDNGSVDLNDIHYISKEVFAQIKNYTISTKDLYISIAGTIGKSGIIPIELDGSNLTENACKLVFKNDIDPKYVYYFTKSDDFIKQAGLNTRIAAMPKLALTRLSTINLKIPKSFLEQQRIVSILDEAFTSIAKAKANAEQNLKNAKELFESYLQSVFSNNSEGWEKKPLEDLGIITSSKRIYKSEYVKAGIPFYRTKELKELSNGKEISLELFISREKYLAIKRSFGVPQVKDLLMSAVGTIGEILVIENDDEFYFKDGNIVWFKEFKSLDTNYLKFALTAFAEKIKSLAIGSAYSALTIEKLNKYKISFPESLEDQQLIVQNLEALLTETKKLEAIYQQKINYLEELKKSILQKAFAGELRVSDLVDPNTGRVKTL